MFSKLLAAHRHRLGLTQEELARRAGLSVRAVRDLESSRVQTPRHASVRLLADALGLQGPPRDDFVREARASSAPAPDADAAQVPMPAPAQLPMAVPGFSGRTSYLEALDAAVGADPGTVVVATVSGTAGVGKTALTIHWAHRVRDRFPGGQLYVDLRGFDPSRPPVAPAMAVRLFLDALGVPSDRVPADPDARTALYRTLLAGRRMLVVLDNARDAEQVRPLLPGAAGCLVVVTSRSDLAGLVTTAGARPLTLTLLTALESRRLLAARLGPQRLDAEPDAVTEIVESCAGLPLALALVAARGAARPDLRLADLATALRSPAARLEALAERDPGSDPRTVFSWSYRACSEAAAGLFRLLGAHPGPDISAAAAASLAGLPPAEVRPLLAELTRAHLLDEHLPQRFRCHDLLRAYAQEQATSDEEPRTGREATRRLLDHYLASAYAADRRLDPLRQSIVPVEPGQGVTPESFADAARAQDWFTVEHDVLLAVVEHSVAVRSFTHAWQLAWCLATFLDSQGHWDDYITTQETALASAQRLGDIHAQAVSHRQLARAHGRLGRLDEAHAQLKQALDAYAAAGDKAGQGHTHLNLAWVTEQQSRSADALQHGQLALGLYQEVGDRQGQAMAFNAIGWTTAQLGDHQEALAACELAIPILEELDDRTGQAAAWDSIGFAHHNLGHHAEAASCYRRALVLYQEVRDRYLEADTWAHLGDTQAASGDADGARDAFRRALDILDELAHGDAEQVRSRLQALDAD